MTRAWTTLGVVAPSELTDARLQLHHAAQVVSSAGFTFVAPREDFSHTSMEWSSSLGALVSRPAGEKVAFRAALAVGELRLLLLEGTGSDRIAAEYELTGHTVDQAYSWLQQAIEDFTETPLAAGLVRPAHKIPQHRVGGGQLFSSGPGETLEEWARWFDNSAGVLWDIQEVTAHASPVRCWPHHFDIATLVRLEPGKDPESGASIGIGMSPGDADYSEPYFYVTPWPHPQEPRLPPLEGGGEWHADGWLGAVLTASALAEDGGDRQFNRVASFLASASQACRELTGVEPS